MQSVCTVAAARPASAIATRRRLIAWAFVSFAVNLGFSRFSYGVVLPALHREFPASYGAFGVVNSVNLGAYLLGTVLAPFVVRDERWCGRAYVISTLLVGIGLAGSAAVHDLAALAAWRALIGFTSAIAIVSTTVITFARVVPANRGRASTAMWAGLALGVAAAGPIEPFTIGDPALSWRIVWLAMAVLAPIAAGGFSLAARRVDPLPHGEPTKGGESFALSSLADPRRYLFLDLAYLAFGVGYIAYATFAVALFRAHGVPAGGIGLAWTLIGLCGVAGAYAAGKLLDSHHKDRVLAASLAFGAVGSAFAATSSLGGALASAVLFGIGMPVTPAAITAIIRRRSSARSYPASYSAVTSLLCIGQFLGPLAVGPFVDRFGLGAVATFSAIVYLAGTVLAACDARFAARCEVNAAAT